MRRLDVGATPEDVLWRGRQAAEAIAISHRTLEGWRRKRKGPAFVAIGGTVRYRRSDVLGWIAAQRSIGGAQ